MSLEQDRRLVSIAQAAEELSVCPKTVRRYIAQGRLEAVRIGTRTIRIRANSIDQLASSNPLVGVQR